MTLGVIWCVLVFKDFGKGRCLLQTHVSSCSMPLSSTVNPSESPINSIQRKIKSSKKMLEIRGQGKLITWKSSRGECPSFGTPCLASTLSITFLQPEKRNRDYPGGCKELFGTGYSPGSRRRLVLLETIHLKNTKICKGHLFYSFAISPSDW